MMVLLLALAFVALSPGFAHAYLGPGIAAGTLATVLGFLCTIFLALFAVVWYPIKQFLKTKPKKEHGAVQNEQ
jgi:hypothetical protein